MSSTARRGRECSTAPPGTTRSRWARQRHCPGGAGNDHMDGGAAGTDTISYADATAAVTVNLTFSTAQNTGGSGTDTLLNFENLTGSNFNDKLTGTAAANALYGLGGMTP